MPTYAQPRMDSTPNGLHPELTELRMGLNIYRIDSTLKGTLPRMDWTQNGTQPRMDLTLNGTQHRMDWTQNGTQHRIDLTPNGTQPQIPLILKWNNFNCSKKNVLVCLVSNFFNMGLNSEWDSTYVE